MKTALLALGSITLAGCAAQAPTGQAAAAPATAKDCLVISQISGRRAEPPNSVTFEMVGPVNYRNDLVGECPGLARLGSQAVIEFANPFGGQICRNDHIRVFDPIEARATGARSAPLCRLGPFVPLRPGSRHVS